ncbi:Fe-Mn family superoxide dismutase [Paenibacillus marinisediminis]
MLLIYGMLMPVRLLEEIQQWKNQEKEHAAIIRQIVPNLEPSYSQVLTEWEHVFAKTEDTSRQWLHSILNNGGRTDEANLQQIELLLKASNYQSEQFIQQMEYLKQYSQAIRGSSLAETMIAHIVRESYVFLSMVQGLVDKPLATVSALAGPAEASAEPWHEAASTSGAAASGGQQQSEPMAHIHSATGGGGDTSIAARIGSGWQTGSGVQVRNSGGTRPDDGAVPIGGHTLPPLPYAYNALEPYIDAETMRIHHDKHHQSYVDGLNKAELALAEARRTGNFDRVKALERDLAFNGAGHYLHTIFWDIMSPRGGGKPSGELLKQIESDFGSYDAFKQHFSKAAENVEGGGWSILVWSPRSHRLEILQAEKHQNLSQWDVVPLLPLDVWEHAYYLKHQNKRADYIKDWWNVVNWPAVNDRYMKARELKWKPY